MEQHAASAAAPPQSPWYTIDEAHGCTFRWHRPADFLVWRAHLPELDAARPFDVRATVSPPRWRVRGQGTTKREARPRAYEPPDCTFDSPTASIESCFLSWSMSSTMPLRSFESPANLPGSTTCQEATPIGLKPSSSERRTS